MKKILFISLILISCLLYACKDAISDTQSSFLFISDTQANEENGDYTELGTVLNAAINEKNIAFILHGGDAVNDGDDEDEWDKFFAAYNPSCGDIPLYMTAGNHDDKEQPDPPQDINQGPQSGFYSFDKADKALHITVLNSNYMGMPDDKLLDWVKNDLYEAKDADFRIILMHYPLHPSPDNIKDVQKADVQRPIWEPIFEQYGVDLVLNGHQHIYNRLITDSGITYLMTATGSKPAYSLTPPENAIASYTGITYTHFLYDDNKLNAISYDKDGNIIDEFILE